MAALKDLYVKRNGAQSAPRGSWAEHVDELNKMSAGVMQQGETAGNGALGWLKDSADAGFFSSLGGTARLAGEFLPFGNETLNSWADKADEIARRNSPQPGQNLEGLDYVASAVGNALGSGAASALEAGAVAAAASGLGSLAGVGGLAGTVGGIASKAIPGVGAAAKVGKTLWKSPMGKYLVAKVGGSPFEAASEAGNLISDMRNENQQGTANYSDEEIRDAAIRSGALNLAWLTGMNMLEAGTLGKITGALGGDMAAKGVKDIAKRTALGGAADAINEGAEEYGQNLIGDYSKRGSTSDFNYDEAWEAAKMGAIGGGVLGGIGSGLSATFSKKNNNDVSAEVDSEGGTIEDGETTTTQDAGREAFINAIAGQESGGNYDAVNSRTGAAGKYQIMPENWPAWAEEAGLGADAEMTPENQEIVARYKLGEYYDKYGPRGAAMAWYAGEGSLNYSEEALNRRQGNGDEPSINEYADSVLARMGNYADTARVDDSEENYFDESNYTDQSILDATRSARGFDLSHLDNGEASDRADIENGADLDKKNPVVDGLGNIRSAMNAVPNFAKSRSGNMLASERAKAIARIVNAGNNTRTFMNNINTAIPSGYLQQMQRASAVVPVSNAAIGRAKYSSDLSMQNGRANGLSDDELNIIRQYQGNPDAFNRQYKKSVEAILKAVKNGDITKDVGRAYLKNIENMYNAVINLIENNGVILQPQDTSFRKTVNRLREQFKQGNTGKKHEFLSENGRTRTNNLPNMYRHNSIFTQEQYDAAQQEYAKRMAPKQALLNILAARIPRKYDEEQQVYADKIKANPEKNNSRVQEPVVESIYKGTGGWLAAVQNAGKYGADQIAIKHSDALAQNFDGTGQLPNISTQKPFDNKIQTNIMRKRNRVGNATSPDVKFAQGESIPSMMQAARSPREMANAANAFWAAENARNNSYEFLKQEQKQDNKAAEAKAEPTAKSDKDEVTAEKPAEEKKVEKKQKEQVKQVEEKQEEETFLPKGIMAKVNLNDKLNGVEVKFSDKPGPKVAKAMRDAGYGWSSKKQLWYSKQNNPDSMAMAEKLGYKPVEKVEETTKSQSRDLELEHEELLDTFADKLGIDNILSVEKAKKEFGDIEIYNDGAIVYHDKNNRYYYIISKDESLDGYKYRVSKWDLHHLPLQDSSLKNASEVIGIIQPGAKPSADIFSKNPDALFNPAAIDKIVKGEAPKEVTDIISKMPKDNSEQTKGKGKDSAFNGERAKGTLDKLFGKKKTKAPKANDSIKVVDVFDESKLDDWIKKAKDSLKRLNANPMFDPDLMNALFHVGGIYAQKGINKFADWSRIMVGALGEKVKPYLTAAWKCLGAFKGDNVDSEVMQAVMEYVGSETEKGRSIDEVQKELIDAYGEELKPYIQPAYVGVQNWGSDASENVVEFKQDNTKGGSENGNNTTRTGSLSESERPGQVQGAGSGEQTGRVSGQSDEQHERPLQRPENEPAEERPSTGGSNGTGSVSAHQGQGENSAGTAGRGTVPLTPAQKKDAKPSETPGHNYTVTKDSLGDGGVKTKYQNNVKAIKLLKQLEAEGRAATPAEQEILANYVGWGGLSPVFNINYRGDAMDPSWTKEAKELKELLTDEEYKAARASTTTAFYTPVSVIKNIYKALERIGFKGGKVLEPSMGTGNFFGVMPESMRNKSSLNGIELDPLTGRIAKQLYQKANIEITGFEKANFPDGYFDLAISNVPFGSFRLSDSKYDKYGLNIHNYFFAKAMDKVRPGGLVCFVTSTDTMQGRGDSAKLRQLLKGKADFVGAIRLPDTTFKANANTEVTSDVIILQKRKEGAPPSKFTQEWLNTVPSGVKGKYGDELEINEYYKNNPEMVIGELKAGGQWGSLVVDGRNVDIAKDMAKAVKKLPANIYEARTSNRNNNSVESAQKFLAPSNSREGALIAKDGKVYHVEQSQMVEMPKTIQKKALDYVGLRDTAKKLLAEQVNPATTDEQLAETRAELNKAYDKFVKDYGPVNDPKNIKNLSLDPDYGVLEAIEDYKVDPLTNKVTVAKRAIFSKRTVNPVKEVTHADNVNDALTLSMSQTGGVDLEYMSGLMDGKSRESILKELGDRVFENPVTNDVELAEAYLSGNVREKLEFAETAAKTDKRFERNIEALKKVQPKDLGQEDVAVSLGAPWIPASDIQEFSAHLLGSRFRYMDIKYIPAAGTWKVDWGNAKDAKGSVAATQTWGTKARNVKDLLEAALNQSTPTVRVTDMDGKSHVDQEATIAAQAKLREIQEEFKKWIWTDKGRTERLLAYYNRNFNNWVLRNYDGSALNFPGYSTAEPQLKQHQKDVVWRILQDGTCLMAHCVGAGKTWSMQTAAMELKRLGLANKSMFVIPNHMLQQFENEFRRIYPNAKLLTISSETLPDVNVAGASKMSKAKLNERKAAKNAKRQSILGKIATEDWDGIIISHNIFKRIPMSPEAYNRFYEQQIEEVEQAITDISVSEGGRRNNSIVKTLEKTKKNLESKLKQNVNEEAKDIVIPFEQLGVDQIFVDEADLFKNLYFTTKMQNIAGMSQANSQRSMDMFMKTQYLINTNNGRGVVFATGTPISNTMAEMFTMLRYLDNKGLKDKNLGFFDNWAATFATKETTTELAPDGSGYRAVEKFTKFNNMPELIKMFRKVADVKKIEDLDLEIPKLKNGKPTVVEIPMNSALETYIKETAKKRAIAIHNRAVDPKEDNMLKLTGDLRKASLDMRLVDPSVPASVAGGKIKAVVDHVADKYKETADVDGVQLVFCDLSTPKGASDKINESDSAEVKEEAEDSNNITVYAEIKKGLVKKGIPANQIAFIHDAKTKTQKEQLFERCRQGQVRVLIGSTEKMGAGTNIQKKLVAEHHVDAPWRPRDIEQREGRILRQGNDNKEVEIFNYVTKGSFDANMWEKLKNKATMIGQAMSGNLVQRSLEDADATVLSFAEVEALASGNPLMAERVMVNAKLTQYEALAESYRRDQEKNKRILAAVPNNIKLAEDKAEKAKTDIKRRTDISGENFSMVIGRNKTVYTSRTEAKAELERIASHYTNELGGVVAKAGGFDIRFRAIPAGKLFSGNDGKTAYKASEDTVRAEIVGEDTYFCEPTQGSIEYAIMHAPDKALAEAKKSIADNKELMKQLEVKINEPFKYADEYEALKKRSAEIEEELNKANTQYSISDEATTRSRAEVEAEIKKALPSAELEQQADGSYIATMPNGKKLGIFIEDQILLNKQQAAEAGRAHNRTADEAEGYWNSWERLEGKNVDGVLRVSRNSRVGTAFHETLHAAMDLCLTSKEKAALYKSFAKKAQESGRSVDEEIADAYKEWTIKRQQGKGTMFGKLFQKAKDFLNKLYTMFVEAENKGNIFRKLESGKAWEQEVYSSSEAPKFNISSANIKKFINAALKNPAKHLRLVLGKVTEAEAEAIKKATGLDVSSFTHVWFSEDVRHTKNRHGEGNETQPDQIGLTEDDISKAIEVIKSPNRIEKGSSKNNQQSIRFMKTNGKGEYTVVEVVRNSKKQLAIKTMWNKKEAVTTKRHADKISPQYTSETGSGNTASTDNLSSSEGKVKYSVAPGNNKIASAFTNTERKGIVQSVKDYVKDLKESWYKDIVDKNNPFKGFDELTKATGGMSVYEKAQNIPGTTAGTLKAACEGTTEHLKAINSRLKKKMKYNVTLSMALNVVNKDSMNKTHPNYLEENGFKNWPDAFGAYLGVERELEMHEKAKAEGKTYTFSNNLTEAELREFVRKAPPQFAKAADMFYKVNDNMITIMEDAQVFSPKVAETLRKYKKYCPLQRDFSDTAAFDTFIGGLTSGGRGIGNVGVPLEKILIEGSDRTIMNPLESVLKSYAVMINRAERNRVGLMAVNAAKTAQLHDIIKEMPERKDSKGRVIEGVADPKNCIFTVLVNGRKKAYQTTQELYGPIVGYNLPAASLTLNVARMTAHMLRTGATMSPSFILRNLLRDTVFAAISSKNGFIPVVDSICGAMALWNDPAMRAEFEATGVTEFNFYGSQASRIKSLDKMMGEKPVGLWEMIKWAGEHLEAASDFVESSTRMGEYMKARKNGLSMEEAARAAREVTLDFSRSGVVGEQINRYVPFFNACIQGGDKMVRLFREDPWGTSQKLFQYIVLPSLILWAMNHDEDWYKDLDPDVKNNYWCLGEHLRIPKPQEAGVLFGSGIEALLDQANGKDKDALKNMAKAWVSNMVPGIVPTVFLPLLEWQANYSYFKGKALVGSKYQRLPDELQYNDYTSELSKAIGNNPLVKVSPMKVDNLIRGYTGTMGALLWSAPDALIGDSKNLPEKHLSERVFFRDFALTDANKSRPMNDFYDILDKANRQHAGYGVKGKPAEAVKSIRSAGNMISKVRKDIDKITHSNLTPERKRELIDKRKEKMNQIAKKATERYGKYFE